MGLFQRIWAAFGRIADAANAVADNLNGIAASFKEANANVRERLALDAVDPAPALPAPDEAKKGRKASA